jgi:hypothetical protein
MILKRLPRGLMRLRTLCIILPFITLAYTASAQVFDMENDRVQVVELHGMWRFHTGDDADGKLGWASPSFDDSSWISLRSDEPWSTQGYSDYAGMAWYRFKVFLPAKHPPLALYIPEIDTSYQVFAGGRLIGQMGGLPPHERALNYRPGGASLRVLSLGQIMPIPDEVVTGGGSLAIVIRVWRSSYWVVNPGGPLTAIRIGDTSLLNDQQNLQRSYAFWYLSAQNVILLGCVLAALAGLGLFLLRPSEGEYLWFAAAELLNAAYCAWTVYPAFHPAWYQAYEALNGLLLSLRGICFAIFLLTLLKEQRRWLFWIAIGSNIFAALAFIPMEMEWMSLAAWIALVYLAWIPYILSMCLMVALAAARGNLDARLLLGPWCIQNGAVLGEGLLLGIYGSGHGGAVVASWLNTYHQLLNWPFPISVQNIADFLLQISILAILVLRFARTRRDEERHSAELEAARVVQHVLVPDEIPAIPGFQIQSVYKPAGQVGGDFFQIIPLPDGGLLAAIGDVSGKGIPAAMTVSLLVGTLRTLAHYTHGPGEILAAMNQRMLARTNGGFTTCLILRVDPEGDVVVANAGHLAPYCNGLELNIEGGLPLGLSAHSNYPETTFSLNASEQLTLLTDGVVEARGKGGELFGFARTQAISREDAEKIAQAAQKFGQDDDITVLTLCHTVVPATAGRRLQSAKN